MACPGSPGVNCARTAPFPPWVFEMVPSSIFPAVVFQVTFLPMSFSASSLFLLSFGWITIWFVFWVLLPLL